MSFTSDVPGLILSPEGGLVNDVMFQEKDRSRRTCTSIYFNLYQGCNLISQQLLKPSMKAHSKMTYGPALLFQVGQDFQMTKW